MISREVLHREGYYPEESSGLFVGISQFDVDKSIGPVPFAVDDAVDLAWVFSSELGLIEAPHCVLALAGEPRKETSRRRLAGLIGAGAKIEYPGRPEILQQAKLLGRSGGPRGLFVLALATHGLSENAHDVLLAADSRRSRIPESGIEVAELSELAATALARRRLFVVDACRERLSRSTRSFTGQPTAKSFASALVQAEGYTVLMGSVAGGYSYDDDDMQNGVFTGALVNGLLGAAPPDERGFITVEKLADYAQQQVVTWVSLHRPAHKGVSLGIEKRFDQAAQTLPLAMARSPEPEKRAPSQQDSLPHSPSRSLLLRLLLGLASFGLAAAVGAAPWLGKFQLPGFDALLQLFPQELQDVLIPLSSFAMGLTALAVRFPEKGSKAFLKRWSRRLPILAGLFLAVLIVLYFAFVVRVPVGAEGRSVAVVVSWQRLAPPFCACEAVSDLQCIGELSLDPAAIESCWGSLPLRIIRLGLSIAYLGLGIGFGALVGLLMLRLERDRAARKPVQRL